MSAGMSKVQSRANAAPVLSPQGQSQGRGREAVYRQQLDTVLLAPCVAIRIGENVLSRAPSPSPTCARSRVLILAVHLTDCRRAPQ